MSNSLSRIDIVGLHGRVDIALDFHSDVNILYGRNGSGKTTILHIISNVLNRSIDRFAYLDFGEISLRMESGQVIRIMRSPAEADSTFSRISVSLNGDTIVVFDPDFIFAYDAIYRPSSRFLTSKGYRFLPPYLSQNRFDVFEYFNKMMDQSRLLPVEGVAYFPAFRAMIEAWRSTRGSSLELSLPPPTSPDILDTGEKLSVLTPLARDLFGNFVPEIDFPSVLEIESELDVRAREAAFDLATESEEILLDAFVSAFEALARDEHHVAESTDEIRKEIERVLQELNTIELVEISRSPQTEAFRRLQQILPSVQASKVSNVAARVLAVYRDSLQQQVRTQRTTLQPIKQYIQSVNEFLEGKKVVITASTAELNPFEVLAEFADGSREKLRTLSSGERQVVSMLYAASPLHIAKSGLVLIDEPELSLHIDWQRLLIKRLVELLEGRQLIVCTHSPEIGAEFEEKYQVVNPLPSRSEAK